MRDEPTLLLQRARIPDGARSVCDSDILISADGRILELAPRLVVAGVPTLDLRGCLAVPAFIDMHQHLDKTATLRQAPNPDGTLLGAIHAFRDYAQGLQHEDVVARAQVTLDRCVAMGTGLIRSHVNVDHEAGLRGVQAITALRAANRERIQVQIVAFATSSAARGDPEQARALLEHAVALGADCIGGTPNLAPDPQGYIAMLLDVAERHALPVDLHVDETLDPSARWFDHLVEQVARRRMGQQVVGSHVCSLAAQDDAVARRTMDAAAAAGVGVCTLPAANLFLQARDRAGLVPRGLTRVRELMNAGVIVAAASDNIQDAFVPVGSGDMLEMARWTLLSAHLLEHAAGTAFEMITTNPARLIGLHDRHGLHAGAWADLVFTRCADVEELVAGSATDRAVMHRGKMVAGNLDAL